MIDDNTVATVAQVDPLIPGRAASLVARAWEAPPGTIKPSDGLRVHAWVSMGVPRARLIQALQRDELARLRRAAGGL